MQRTVFRRWNPYWGTLWAFKWFSVTIFLVDFVLFRSFVMWADRCYLRLLRPDSACVNMFQCQNLTAQITLLMIGFRSEAFNVFATAAVEGVSKHTHVCAQISPFLVSSWFQGWILSCHLLMWNCCFSSFIGGSSKIAPERTAVMGIMGFIILLLSLNGFSQC